MLVGVAEELEQTRRVFTRSLIAKSFYTDRRGWKSATESASTDGVSPAVSVSLLRAWMNSNPILATHGDAFLPNPKPRSK
jgi:hypothetical protein